MKKKIVYMVFAILVIALLFVVENFLLSSIYRVKNNFTPNVAQLAVATTDFCVIDNSLLRKKLIKPEIYINNLVSSIDSKYPDSIKLNNYKSDKNNPLVYLYLSAASTHKSPSSIDFQGYKILYYSAIDLDVLYDHIGSDLRLFRIRLEKVANSYVDNPETLTCNIEGMEFRLLKNPDTDYYISNYTYYSNYWQKRLPLNFKRGGIRSVDSSPKKWKWRKWIVNYKHSVKAKYYKFNTQPSFFFRSTVSSNSEMCIAGWVSEKNELPQPKITMFCNDGSKVELDPNKEHQVFVKSEVFNEQYLHAK